MKVQYFKSNKYGNKSCSCRAGHKHDSVFEAEYCDQLSLLVKAREIKSFKTQVSYDLPVNGKSVAIHIVDFEVITKEGTIEVHETKGFATDLWHLKYKLFVAIYPEIPYHVISKDYKYGRGKEVFGRRLRFRRGASS